MPETKKRFQQTREDFTCERCMTEVKGNGYTNHCPKCLWSRHVDIHPGDRKEACRGMMRPIGWEQKKGEYVLIHRCEICGFTRRNRMADKDDMEALIRLPQLIH